MKKEIIVVFLFLMGFQSVASQDNIVIPDSLKGLSYSELVKRINLTDKLSLKEIYAHAFLERGKAENNHVNIVGGYEILATINEGQRAISYYDTIITLTVNNPDIINPSNAYLATGHEYYDLQKYKEALDNYLWANNFALKNDNPRLVYESRHGIGILKDRIGEYGEALKLHKENLSFFKFNIDNNNYSNYLNTLFSLSIALNRTKNIDSASTCNIKGIEFSKKFNDKKMYNLFVLNEGISQYYRGDLQSALDSINKSVNYLKGIKNQKRNIVFGYYFLSEIYKINSQKEKTIHYLKQIDTIFTQTGNIHPELRLTYKSLITYYKNEKDIPNQIKYLTRLISVDSILNNNQIYLQKNLKIKYDIPNLIIEKEQLITELETQKNKIIYIVTLVITILCLSIFLLYGRQRALRKKFEILVNKSPTKLKSNYSSMDIPDRIIEEILAKLKQFEENHYYIDPSINLINLAKKFGTNSNYLSKVINSYWNKNFTTYINELRINYAVEKLKKDSTFRKYTVSAVAETVGFKNSETFSKLFKKMYGIYPSYFIKRLNKT